MLKQIGIQLLARTIYALFIVLALVVAFNQEPFQEPDGPSTLESTAADYPEKPSYQSYDF